MGPGTTLRCDRCGERVEDRRPGGWDCGCGRGRGNGRGDGDSRLDIVHDEASIRESFTPSGCIDDQWRYAPFLPVGADARVSLGEGGTTLTDAPTAGDRLGVDLSLKLEGENPTGSTKDRGSSVLVSDARQRDAAVIACASTGNAAASVAAYTARGSLSCRLFVPASLPKAKAVQPLVYGATLLAVEGDYDDAYDLCRATSTHRGWRDRSAGASVHARAGARTLGYELADALAVAPDWVVVPMGNGGTIAGAWRGFRTFADLGFVSGTPRMLGVQAAGASAIHDAVGDGPGDASTGTDGTCADSIDVGTPHRLEAAGDALAASGGTSVAVTDGAIESATASLGRAEGVFVEPACAAAIAGIETARERGLIDRGDRVLAVMTGTGLKDTETARRALGGAERIPPDADPREIARRYSPGE